MEVNTHFAMRIDRHILSNDVETILIEGSQIRCKIDLIIALHSLYISRRPATFGGKWKMEILRGFNRDESWIPDLESWIRDRTVFELLNLWTLDSRFWMNEAIFWFLVTSDFNSKYYFVVGSFISSSHFFCQLKLKSHSNLPVESLKSILVKV